MAILDIQSELQKDVKLDSSLEKKLCTAILDRIEKDTSNDVQGQHAKVLSARLRTLCNALFPRSHIRKMFIRACQESPGGSGNRGYCASLPPDPRGQCRAAVSTLAIHSFRLSVLIVVVPALLISDVYGIGMKTLVADADERHGRAVVDTAAPFLLRGLNPSSSVDVRSEALDLATELIRRFGSLPDFAARLHASFLVAFVAQLAGPTPLVRKRAIAAIGALATSLNETLLEALVSVLLRGIEGGGDKRMGTSELDSAAALASPRTLIQCTCTVSRQVGVPFHFERACLSRSLHGALFGCRRSVLDSGGTCPGLSRSFSVSSARLMTKRSPTRRALSCATIASPPSNPSFLSAPSARLRLFPPLLRLRRRL